MDLPILFFLVFGCIGLAVLIHRRTLKQYYARPERKEPCAERPAPPLKQPDQVSEPKTVVPDRFEEETAEDVPDTVILSGRASIVDGDTIYVNRVSVRLFGIDAPELEHPYGQKAKWALVSLCKGLIVTVRVTETDAYGRTVGICTLPDGRDLSAEMVKMGLAIDWPKYSGGKYSALEVSGVRRRLWLADARQKGRMHVWAQFEERQAARSGQR